MDNALWETIEKYDLDDPISEYGFSTRLQNENFWPLQFTEQAILEYKKFMYLAASTDLMVSPSEIIDLVWHQHLIFTTSYDHFCGILGKKIEHIPSTHNHKDFEKFQLAKERTQNSYLSIFGSQPEAIWAYSSMYEPLQLPKHEYSKPNLVYGLIFLIALFSFSYYSLTELYPRINNPYFMIGYLFLIVTVAAGLARYNRSRLVALLNSWPKDAFVFNLSPDELIYATYQDLSYVIHGVVSHLIHKDLIRTLPDSTLISNGNQQVKSVKEFCTLQALQKSSPISYEKLLPTLMSKPGFNATARVMTGFNKYLRKSAFFMRLYGINIMVLFTLFFLGLVRLFTGISNEKPIILLIIALTAYLAFIIYYLLRIKTLFSTKVLTEFYRNQLIPSQNNSNQQDWDYFLLGTAALVPFLIPIVERRRDDGSNSGSDGGSSSSSDGSSCGSSCGSCGGCGGD